MFRSKENVFETVKVIAEVRGGKCITREYKNVFTPLRFRCANGHLFKIKPQRILPYFYTREDGKRINTSCWCPKCRKQGDTYITREQWKADRREKYMHEVDQFCKRQKHKLLSGIVTGTRDRISFRCDKGHIFHTYIHHIIQYNKTKTGDCIRCKKNVYTLKTLKDYAKSFKGNCLSKKYEGHKRKYLWQCENHHLFVSKWRTVKDRDYFCPWCKFDIGHWKLPNLNHEKKVLDFVEQKAINMSKIFWNKTSNK